MCCASKAFFIWQHIVTEMLFAVCDPRGREDLRAGRARASCADHPHRATPQKSSHVAHVAQDGQIMGQFGKWSQPDRLRFLLPKKKRPRFP